jgi:hypothetical protein
MMRGRAAVQALARTAILVVGIYLGNVGLHAVQAPEEKPPSADSYQKVDVTDRDVQAAVKFALADQQRKDGGKPRLLSIISAERQFVSADNFRLCLSLDRSGRTEFARVVLSRNAKKRWSVTIWSWGACNR